MINEYYKMIIIN